jgi:hypothetical protein
METGNVNDSTTVFNSFSTSDEAFPLISFLTKTYSTPFSSSKKMSSGDKPCPRTKPSAAFDQVPSACKAIFFAGPLTTSAKSACLSLTPLAMTAKRLGVAYISIASKPMRFSSKKAAIFSFSWILLLRTYFAGISSSPISNNTV